MFCRRYCTITWATFLVAAMFMTSNAAAAAEGMLTPSELFASWRIPVGEDIGGDWAWALEEGIVPFTANADFDGNSTVDSAWLMINESESSNWGIFVVLRKDDALGSVDRVVPIYTGKNDNPPQRFGVSVMPPGRYTRACAKGYGDPCANESEKSIRSAVPGVQFFMFESAASVFFWRGEDVGFRRYWLSD